MKTPFWEREMHGGVQKVYVFPNGYGASVVRHSFSYGGNKGLWELAVLDIKNTEPLEWEISYDTPITNDVVGYLNDEQVEKYLKHVELL